MLDTTLSLNSVGQRTSMMVIWYVLVVVVFCCCLFSCFRLGTKTWKQTAGSASLENSTPVSLLLMVVKC